MSEKLPQISPEIIRQGYENQVLELISYADQFLSPYYLDYDNDSFVIDSIKELVLEIEQAIKVDHSFTGSDNNLTLKDLLVAETDLNNPFAVFNYGESGLNLMSILALIYPPKLNIKNTQKPILRTFPSDFISNQIINL